MSERNKYIITIYTIIASLAPTLLLLQFPTHPSINTISLWASAVAGYMGIVLLLWMYVLGTKAITSIVYSDLAPMLKLHKWLGKYGSIVIFLHPILITISYGERWYYSLLPKIGSVTERHILLGQIAMLLLLATWAISLFIRNRMRFRPWKYTHYLAYVCVPFALLHVPDLGSQEMTHVTVKVYLILLVLIYLIFTVLRVRSLLNLDRLKYVVVQHTQPSPVDYILKLRPVGPNSIYPKFGQYVYVKLGFLSEDHPFSVSQYNQKTGELTLMYRLAGMYSKELTKVNEGRTVLISGPYGTFTADLSAEILLPAVFIAGGIGITPFIDRILNETSTREQWLFLANRTKNLAIPYQPLKKRLGNRMIAIFSGNDVNLEANEERGHVTVNILKKYLGNPTKYHYYLCGSPAMIDSTRLAIVSLRVPESNIHFEEFGW